MKELSAAALSLWGKKGTPGEMSWLPLYVHLADAAGIISILWDNWLPDQARHLVEPSLGGNHEAKKLLLFLAAAHDLGKASPIFQSTQRRFPAGELDVQLMENLHRAGLPCGNAGDFSNRSVTPHALISEQLLLDSGCDAVIAAMVGAHHGRPATSDLLDRTGMASYAANYHQGSQGKAAWQAVQGELLAYALRLSGYSVVGEIPRPDFPAQLLISGLLIMADWIASNEDLFPYFAWDEPIQSQDKPARAQAAWDRLGLPKGWMHSGLMPGTIGYSNRFGIKSPYPIQLLASDIAMRVDRPGVFIIEAPMGCGKTEAALLCAEIFAGKTEAAGLFFALPTQATSNAMFPRLLAWTKALEREGCFSIRLAHGKAQFNEDYVNLLAGSRHIGESREDAVVHQWFEGSKKSLLADFVVGTIDQFLMAALRQKHVMLRHLGLAGKVVVLDECHAYDAYMNHYLDRALAWMGAYGVPVIILSATLPARRRADMVCAYMGRPVQKPHNKARFGQVAAPEAAPPAWADNRDYPLITWTDGGVVHQQTVANVGPSRQVRITHIQDSDLPGQLRQLLANGGYAGVMVNTVRRAQQLAATLKEAFGAEGVTLIHARFIAPDRAKKEAALLGMLGKPLEGEARSGMHIVIGTQVIEQSLDLDFDVLVSDLCPMDLLLQRMGRLHRHVRARPAGLEQAQCLLLGAGQEELEPGAKAVYHTYPLLRTLAFLPEDSLRLPEDISRLVQDVYDTCVQLPDPPPAYEAARAEWEQHIKRQEGRSGTYLIKRPFASHQLTDWMDAPPGDTRGEASVRDSADSLEVLVIREAGEGKFSLLYDESSTQEALLSATRVPDARLARLVARQSLRLPPALCREYLIDQTIHALEESNQRIACWQQSPWLKGLLFLILDASLQTDLCGYHLAYSPDMGLICDKEGE